MKAMGRLQNKFNQNKKGGKYVLLVKEKIKHHTKMNPCKAPVNKKYAGCYSLTASAKCWHLIWQEQRPKKCKNASFLPHPHKKNLNPTVSWLAVCFSGLKTYLMGDGRGADRGQGGRQEAPPRRPCWPAVRLRRLPPMRLAVRLQ